MKIFAIRNDEIDPERDFGYLFWFEKREECYIELPENIDEWDLPFILDTYARNKRWTIGQLHTNLFISQRVIPSDRQNIGSILKENGLDEYDEMKLFLLADGRCAQDDFYIHKCSPESLPHWVKERRSHLLTAVSAMAEGLFLLSFSDGKIAIWNMSNSTSSEKYQRLFQRLNSYYKQIHDSVILSGGASLCLNGNVEITYDILQESAEYLPITTNHLSAFAEQYLMSTQDMTKQLDCSRQNINDLVKRGRIKPLDLHAKVQFFTKEDYYRLL